MLLSGSTQGRDSPESLEFLADVRQFSVRPTRRHKMFTVQLDQSTRDHLRKLIRGKGSRRDQVRAQALLSADQSDGGPGLTDVMIAAQTGLSVRTIETLRKRFVTEGLESAVSWRYAARARGAAEAP